MEDADIWAAFQFLFDDLSKDPRNDVYAKKPLLAHYTSLDNLERILESKEIWLSNPVFMNDHEELRFGLLNGIAGFKRNAAVWTALGDEERRRKFFEALDRQLVDFELNHLINTYVFCLSEHEREDKDGLLSMWRGYGWNGRR